MPFEKGRKKTGGRAKGTPNTNSSSAQLREQVQHLLESQYDRVLADLEALEPKDRVGAWIKLLDFALPKLQRTETVYDLSNLAPEEIDRLFDRATSQASSAK